MPEPVANHAVEVGISHDTICVYSFSGIDESKVWSGIHLKTFKYNTLSQQWSQLADVPDELGKIAAGATNIQDKIYVAGGYYVFEDGGEESSDDLHVFDPDSDSWLPDAAAIPTPIDDQVQMSYRDSLLFLVTGWSDTGNVNDVQIYNPEDDSWLAGDTPPASTLYTAFGASGVITGDTIWYLGGVSNSFSANRALRKGVLNPDDVTDINWSFYGTAPIEDNVYRAAATTYEGQAVWIGGAAIAYNYDGIAYNGSGGVPALDRVIMFDPASDSWQELLGQDEAVMDLRGIAKISENQWIICGGMMDNQQVSDRAFLLTYDTDNHLPVIPLDLPWEVLQLEQELRLTTEESIRVTSVNFSGQFLDSKVLTGTCLYARDKPGFLILESLDGTQRQVVRR